MCYLKRSIQFVIDIRNCSAGGAEPSCRPVFARTRFLPHDMSELAAPRCRRVLAMTRRFALVLVLLVPSVSDGFPALAAEQSASINTVIPAGKWKAVKLRNLPKGASLAIQIVSDGEIVVLLLDEEAIQDFPDVERPLFRGSTTGKLGFELLIPRSATYYAVLDNHKGSAERRVFFSVTGSNPPRE